MKIELIVHSSKIPREMLKEREKENRLKHKPITNQTEQMTDVQFLNHWMSVI